MIDEQRALVGVLPRRELLELNGKGSARAAQAALPPRLVTYPDETLRELARRFATEHLTTALVLDRSDPSRIVGPGHRRAPAPGPSPRPRP